MTGEEGFKEWDRDLLVHYQRPDAVRTVDKSAWDHYRWRWGLSHAAIVKCRLDSRVDDGLVCLQADHGAEEVPSRPRGDA